MRVPNLESLKKGSDVTITDWGSSGKSYFWR